MRARRGVVALLAGRHADVVEGSSDARLISKLAPDRQALLEERARHDHLALVDRYRPEIAQRHGDVRRIPQLPPDGEALLKQRSCRRKAAPAESQMPRGIERLRTKS